MLILNDNSLQEVWWKCSKCGREWKATIQSRKKPNCKICNYKSVAENRHLIPGANDLISLNPDFLKDWNYEKNSYDPHALTDGSHKIINWKCHVCGYEWKAPVYDRTNGHGCPKCSEIRKSKKLRARNLVVGKTDLASKFPRIAKDWDYEKNELLPTEVSYGSSKKVNWICSKCGHKWEATISNRTNRHSQCPKCHGKGIE